jgi:group I intron endonuclease
VTDVRFSPYRSGIYGIRCLVDNRVYVGQARNMGKRWASHRHELDRGRKSYSEKTYVSPDPLYHSWNVHGADMHRFCVLESVDEIAMLTERERYWIQKLNSMDPKFGFNRMLPR